MKKALAGLLIIILLILNSTNIYATEVEEMAHTMDTPIVNHIGTTEAIVSVTYDLDSTVTTPVNTSVGYFEISKDGGNTWTNIGGKFVSTSTGSGTGQLILPEDTLTPDTTYSIRAHIETDTGDVLVSNEVSFTTKFIEIVVTNITATSATFTANYKLQKDSTEQTYPAQLSLYNSHFEIWIPDTFYTNGINFDDLNPEDVSETSATYTATNLQPNTSYTILAQASTIDQNGNEYISDSIEFTTLDAPAQPSTPTEPTSPIDDTVVEEGESVVVDGNESEVETTEELAKLEETGESTNVMACSVIVGILFYFRIRNNHKVV